MSSEPLFSVVLCTRDRAHLLPRALESLTHLSVGSEGAEFLLVDNGSQDETARLLTEFEAAAPCPTRCLHEAKPGLSAARNCALRHARGRWLFFTDDDQEVAPDALLEHARVARAHQSRAQLGAIALRFDGPRPEWIVGEIAEILGETRVRPEGPSDLQLYGGNMVLERQLLAELGGFREDLGKGTVGYSEDTELTHRLRERGVQVVFAPTAVVHHLIGADRTTEAFFRRNSLEKGTSDAAMVASPVGRLTRALRRGAGIPGAWIDGWIARQRGDRYGWVRARCRIAYRWGWLRGGLLPRRGRP